MDDIEAKKREAAALIAELLAVERTESRRQDIVERMDRICPDPAWSDQIYYNAENEKADGSIDIAKAIEQIFSYKAIRLPNRSNEELP